MLKLSCHYWIWIFDSYTKVLSLSLFFGQVQNNFVQLPINRRKGHFYFQILDIWVIKDKFNLRWVMMYELLDMHMTVNGCMCHVWSMGGNNTSGRYGYSGRWHRQHNRWWRHRYSPMVVMVMCHSWISSAGVRTRTSRYRYWSCTRCTICRWRML